MKSQFITDTEHMRERERDEKVQSKMEESEENTNIQRLVENRDGPK